MSDKARGERERLKAEIASLAAERDRLKEALEKIAERCEGYDPQMVEYEVREMALGALEGEKDG